MINRRIKNIKPSATLAVKAAATKLKAEGKKIYDLSCGEPDIDTPEYIKLAAYEAMKNGKTKYTDVAGILELREALAKKFKNDNSISCDAGSVVVTNGGKQAIYTALDVTLEEGDEVIISTPYWVSYPPMVEMCHGTPVIVECSADEGYKLTPKALEKSITPKTKMLIINSPSNPTGAMYTKDEMSALAKVLEKKNILILSDEVYEKIVYGNVPFNSFLQAAPQLADRTITINAFSKSYSMTGWRVGYATGPKEIISAMGKHVSQVTSNVNTPSQYAAIAALNGPESFFKTMNDNFLRRLDMAISLINGCKRLSIPVKPQGAFYLPVRIDPLINEKLVTGSTQFTTILMEKTGVAGVPGIEFGDDGMFRIATATSDEILKEGVTRICELASSL